MPILDTYVLQKKNQETEIACTNTTGIKGQL